MKSAQHLHNHRLLFLSLVFGSQFSWASTPKVLTENEIRAVNSIQLDTSIIALDPTLACGAGAQVRLLAGVAQSYQWTRNGTPIPGAINRNFSAQVSGAYRVKVGDGNGNIDIPAEGNQLHDSPSFMCVKGTTSFDSNCHYYFKVDKDWTALDDMRGSESSMTAGFQCKPLNIPANQSGFTFQKVFTNERDFKTIGSCH